MSDLHKSKWYDLIDMFNYTSRYHNDIFTIVNPEFEKHIPDIYPTYYKFYPNSVKSRSQNMFLKESLIRSSTVI